MGEYALTAAFDPLGIVGIVASTVLTQGIKGAIAKQAIKVLRPVSNVTRKIFAFLVGKKTGFLRLLHKRFSRKYAVRLINAGPLLSCPEIGSK